LCWLELAAIKRVTADTEDALLLNRSALKTFTRYRHTDGMARALYQSGVVLHDRGQLLRSRESIVEAARLFKDIDHKTGESMCANALADIEMDRGDLAAAEALLARNRSAVQRWNIGCARARTELNFARLAMERGRLQQAVQFLDAASAQAESQLARDVQAEIALVRGRYWLLLNDVARLRESVQDVEALVSACGLAHLGARAKILAGELLVLEGREAEAQTVFEDTARRCKVSRQRRRRAEALLGALQISRSKRSLDELVLALSYIKRDARAVDAPVLQMMCQMANALFRGARQRTSIKKWDRSPLHLKRKILMDFLAVGSNAFSGSRARLLEEGPADLYLLRARDPQSALPISVVS
jgi:hypothetical protein